LSQIILALIHEQFAYSVFWIGFYTVDTNQPNIISFWRWEDQTSVVYTDWFPQNPTNASQCANMVTSNNPWYNGTKYWENSHQCDQQYYSVCKQPPICS
jgi:hypothetical protein